MFLEKKPRTFLFFFKAYPVKTLQATILLFLAGLAEIIGIAAFLPFLQIVFDGHTSLERLPEGPIRSFIAFLGIGLDFHSVALFIVAAIAAKALLLWLAMRKVSECVSFVSHDLRIRLMRALLSANWPYFVNSALGSNLNALVMETYRSSLAFISMAGFIASFIQFLVYMLAALLISWRVAVFGMVAGVVIGAALWFLIRIAGRAGQKTTDVTKELLSRMGDIIQGTKPMRAMALEKEFLSLTSGYSIDLKKAQVSKLMSVQAMRISHEPLMVIAAVLGLFMFLALGNLETSALALMTVLFIRMLMGLNKAQGHYQAYVTEQSALWSLMDTIESIETHQEDWPGKDDVPAEVAEIKFQTVSFSHSACEVLASANAVFKRGGLTVLVGASGSGKTTMFDLLCGFYKPSSGVILADGMPITDFHLPHWRHKIGFVPQEVFLFNDTIAENVRMGRKDINDADILRALEAAGAGAFVKALAEGIHAAVGESGRALSGGQRQRIAIARAIVHRPPILLLDEATSALDPEIEARLLETLKDLAQDMIVILSSHRISAAQHADTVYKVESGKVQQVETA